GGVPGVDPGFLDVFHHPAEEEFLAVIDRIDVDLDGLVEEPVDEDRGGQDRVFGGDPRRPGDVVDEVVVVVHDLHPPPADDVGGAYEHGEADLVGDLPRLLQRDRGAVGGGV